MIEAIFFDQDNTIVNTKSVTPVAYRHAIDYLAQKIEIEADGLWREWRKVVKNNKNSLNPRIRSLNYSLYKLCKNKKWVKEAISEIERELDEKLQLNLGVREFFELPKKGIKYILTTEDYPRFLKIKINKFGLKDKFDLIIGNKETGSMKPNRKYFKIAWKKFKLNPAKCIYVGDKYEKDGEIGAQMGGVTVLFGKKDKRADYQIKNFLELKKIIEKIDI